jgi:hypothetical protein
MNTPEFVLGTRFVVITTRTEGGPFGLTIESREYPIDTAEEIAAAQTAMRAAGLSFAPVYAGEGADAVRLPQALWAN